jgi:enterobactin synthetase component F
MSVEFPLSAAQLGVWYALRAGGRASEYNFGEYTKILGAIDPVLFEAALRHVVVEAEALRVRFIDRNTFPRQAVVTPFDWSMTYQDVSSSPDPVLTAEAWMRTDMTQPLDLHHGPFFAFALFKAAPEEFFWYVRYHHLVMDAFGGKLIARRVADMYSSLVAGSEIDCQSLGSLPALVEEDIAYRASRHFTSDRQFWLDSMLDCPEPVSLSIRASQVSGEFLRQMTYLPSLTVVQLQNFARHMQMTIPQVATLATAIFIHRLTEAEDIVLGQFMAARMTETSRQTPAMATNVLPLRLAIQSNMTVEDLAVQVRRKVRAGMRHQRYRIADLRRDLRRVAKPIIGQSINVMTFDYNLQFAGYQSMNCQVSNGAVEDLDFHFVYDQSENGAWRVEFNANPALYDGEFLACLQLRFLQLLAALDAPGELVGRLDILPPDELRQTLDAWNKTSSDYPRDRQVHELFEEQVRRAPERIALICKQQRLTYRELNEQADLLAKHLTLLGVKPLERVGLYVERSLGMVVGLLAILKAGGAYVPLDPNYPQDRLAFILEDCRPLVLLTERGLRDRFRPPDVHIVCLDDLPIQPAHTENARSEFERQPTDLAYVLYTSGSTGQPKGVEIPHRALVNFLKAMEHEPGITIDDVLLSVTSLSFDIAGLELFLPLMVGAQVTIAPSDVTADGFRLAALMKESGATIMQATPATWRLLLEAAWEGSLSLKILCGGEAWPAELADALLHRCLSLWNMYGPTETTVWSSATRIEDDRRVLIGMPIANTTFYVLDLYGQPVPIGVPGELHIGGDGVARGYLNRPELTKERFVADPFSNETLARMYKTGDRVRRLPDGRLEFLGRFDHQVKIRGYRVELGEIEAILRIHPDVQDAVVALQSSGEEKKRLVAYIKTNDRDQVPVSDLREFLRRKLAPYMIPGAFVQLEAFPLTPNGKIDRKALPLPDEQARLDGDVAYVAPRTPLEELLARIWSEHLEVEQVGVHDNFFDLGGDSLMMVRLSLEIESSTGQSFPLPWIFDAPTVAGMAEILGGQKAASSYSPLVLLRPGTKAKPLFMIHPVGGSIMQLIPIAKALPSDYAIYGIQAKGFDGANAPNDRVEAMAECYTNAITKTQPHGPYFLAGMCFGGLVGLEIARRLSERGERIALLAFLDTYPHPRYWPLRARMSFFVTRRIKNFLSEMRTLNGREVAPYVVLRSRILLRKIMLKVIATRFFPKASTKPTVMKSSPAVKAVYDGGIAALGKYRPRYYSSKVNYLVCGYHYYELDMPTPVWVKLIGQLDVDSVPSIHLMAPTHPEYVANWIVDRIQDALAEDVTPKAPI